MGNNFDWRDALTSTQPDWRQDPTIWNDEKEVIEYEMCDRCYYMYEATIMTKLDDDFGKNQYCPDCMKIINEENN